METCYERLFKLKMKRVLWQISCAIMPKHGCPPKLTDHPRGARIRKVDSGDTGGATEIHILGGRICQ